jgi:hypothetical protein
MKELARKNATTRKAAVIRLPASSAKSVTPCAEG